MRPFRHLLTPRDHPRGSRKLIAARITSCSVACFLLLVTPFATFLRYQGYSFARAEVLILIAGLAAISLILGVACAFSQAVEIATIAGLLTFFADIQLTEPGMKMLLVLFLGLCVLGWFVREHIARIVSLMMATTLALAITPTRPEAASGSAGPKDVTRGRSDLPLLVHLVLDEHIGAEGLPPNLTPPAFRAAFENFFVDRGFRLFGAAYSESSQTEQSLSRLFSLAPGADRPDALVPSRFPDKYDLTRNVYFEHLSARGYAVRVFQPDYLDVCDGIVPASRCYTYAVRSVDVLQPLDAPPMEKASVIAGTYLMQSESYMRIKIAYGRLSQHTKLGAFLPAWDWERGSVAPLESLPVFDKVIADVAHSHRGDAIFAHLLLPHYPYIYDQNCRPRPPSEWLFRNDPFHVDSFVGNANTPAGRATRYARYFEQVSCAQQKIDALIRAIPPALQDDAIVLIQGDHGSRISLSDPVRAAEARFAPSDYADHFSTLFAVRSKQLENGYDERRAPITCLLRTLVDHDFRSLDGLRACSQPNRVFFRDDDNRRPLPPFPASSREIARDRNQRAVPANDRAHPAAQSGAGSR